jgi:hypothetical protein
VTFVEDTTSWCPEREEHGVLLAPAFTCTTSVRSAIVHGWSKADPLKQLSSPTRERLKHLLLRSLTLSNTDCFFVKGDKWYYAGIYIGIPFDDLTTTEWDKLTEKVRQI